MNDILEWIVDNIGIVIAGLSGLAAWIEQRSWAQRKLINAGGKWLMKKALKNTRKYRGTFSNEDRELLLVGKLMDYLWKIIGIMAELGFDVKPKKMQSPLKKLVEIPFDKKQIKQNFKKGRAKMKQRDKETLKRLRDNLKMGGLTLLIAIMCLSWCVDTPAVEFIDPEPITADFKLFPRAPHFSILWDAKDWAQHSQISISIVGYKGILFLDFGLVDFEQIETSGDHWWQTLNPSGGITLDLIETARLVPQIEPYIAYIPEYVFLGVGWYARLEDPWSGHVYFSAGLTW